MIAFLGAVAATAIALSFAISGLVRRLAIRAGAVVPARADRWHREPTPTFGGVAIAATTLALSAAAGLWLRDDPALLTALLILGSSLAMFVVGLVDDRTQLTPLAKLTAALSAGAFFLFGLDAVSGSGLTWWQTVAAVIWYAGVVHAFNLLDNMDGLASGVAVVATAALAFVFRSELSPLLLMMLVALCGSLLGFLIVNRPPARLFMGDCGSLFIGAMVAGTSLAIASRESGPLLIDAITICLLLVVPLLDTSFVLAVRRLAGRGATRGGIDHLSHRLSSLGLSVRSAVRTLYLLGLAGGAVAWLVYDSGLPSLPFAALFVIAVVLFAIFLARVPAYDGEDFRALQKASFAPFLSDLTFKWHAIEMLLDVALISLVYYLSYRLRFEEEQLSTFLPSFTASLPVVLGCKLLALHVSGAYSRMWGTFGLRDLFTIARGVIVGSVASILAAAYFYRFERFSRGVFVIDATLLLLALVTVRGSFRMMGEAAVGRTKRGRRVLIYGAGVGGELLVREMRANSEWGMNPVALLDDDPVKFKRRLLGVMVKGGSADIDDVIVHNRIEEVVLSTRTIDPAREQRVRSACVRLGVPVRRFSLEIVE